MKKRWRRKSPKTFKTSADWQAPRYRKLGDVREALEIWASGPASGHEPEGKVALRVVERSAAEEQDP